MLDNGICNAVLDGYTLNRVIMDKYHKLCIYTDFRGEVDIRISDVADFIGHHVPALLHPQKELDKLSDISC